MSDFQDKFTPMGGLMLTNWGGIEIELNRSNDGLRYRFVWGERVESEEIKEAEIEYRDNPDLDETENAENGPFACFVVGEGENETVYFLSDFAKI